MPSAEIDNGFPSFDSEGESGTGGALVFEPPVVREAVSNGYPSRIKSSRGITVLKEGSAYRQVRVPTDDDVQAADIAYIGGYVYPIDSSERADLRAAGYGDRITTTGGGGILATGVVDVGAVLFPYVNEDGATSGEEAELTIVDGFPVFTTS